MHRLAPVPAAEDERQEVLVAEGGKAMLARALAGAEAGRRSGMGRASMGGGVAGDVPRIWWDFGGDGVAEWPVDVFGTEEQRPLTRRARAFGLRAAALPLRGFAAWGEWWRSGVTGGASAVCLAWGDVREGIQLAFLADDR